MTSIGLLQTVKKTIHEVSYNIHQFEEIAKKVKSYKRKSVLYNRRRSQTNIPFSHKPNKNTMLQWLKNAECRSNKTSSEPLSKRYFSYNFEIKVEEEMKKKLEDEESDKKIESEIKEYLRRHSLIFSDEEKRMKKKEKMNKFVHKRRKKRKKVVKKKKKICVKVKKKFSKKKMMMKRRKKKIEAMNVSNEINEKNKAIKKVKSKCLVFSERICDISGSDRIPRLALKYETKKKKDIKKEGKKKSVALKEKKLAETKKRNQMDHEESMFSFSRLLYTPKHLRDNIKRVFEY